MATMTPERLRELLKVEADADLEAAVKAVVDKAAKAETTPQPDPPKPADPPAPTPPADPPVPAPEAGTPAPELVAAMEAAKRAGLSLVSTQALADLQAKAEAGAGAAAKLSAQDQADQVDAALKAGKISPKDADKWRTTLADPAGGASAVALLAALTPVIPVAALGSADTGEANQPAMAEAEEAAWDQWTSAVFPELAEKRAALAAAKA